MPLLSIEDLHVDRGEIVTLVGPNGSGKSALLLTIVGAVARGQLASSSAMCPNGWPSTAPCR